MQTDEQLSVFQRVTITQSDFFAIMQWEGDGGRPGNVIYEILPDEALLEPQPASHVRKPLPKE